MGKIEVIKKTEIYVKVDDVKEYLNNRLDFAASCSKKVACETNTHFGFQLARKTMNNALDTLALVDETIESEGE